MSCVRDGARLDQTPAERDASLTDPGIGETEPDLSSLEDEPGDLDGRTMIGGAPTLALDPGVMLGEYRIERLLGEGGMGTVYAGIQPVIGKKVAIKVISKSLAEDPTSAQRFVQEARAVNQIGHDNIVDIFSFGQLPDGRQYFVMEFLEGRTLRRQLDERRPLAFPQVFTLLWQVADALEAAHEANVVHRDLKPDNIFLVPTRSGDLAAKLVDFGIAKLVDAGGQSIAQTQAGVLLGTPLYMSPEQALGRRVDARADIYSLGIILYELFTGRVPFYTESYLQALQLHMTARPQPPREIVPGMAPELERLILSMLEKDPATRPANAGAIKVALHRCAQIMCGSSAAPQSPLGGLSGGPIALPAPMPMPLASPALGALPTPDAAYYASPGRTGSGRRTSGKRTLVLAIAASIVALGILFALIVPRPDESASPPLVPAAAAPAPPEEHLPVTGTLIVHTNVRSASFYLDGKPVVTATGDATIAGLDPSRAHQVRIEASGRRTETRTIDVGPGTTQEITVALSSR